MNPLLKGLLACVVTTGALVPGSWLGAQDTHGIRMSSPTGSTCALSTNTHKAELDQSYVQGDVRAFYSRQGPHALYTLEDRNGNGVPDMVEDAVTHVHAVRAVLNLNGYQDPLKSPRFAGARFIDIDFLNFPVYSEARTGNRALSFSRVLRFAARDDACAISIAIHSQSPNNHERVKGFLIPHEVFHLYEYGHTMFRQGWFLEGMAKWVEWMLAEENTRNPLLWKTPLPHDRASLERQVLANPNPYDARHFWNRLAELVSPYEPTARYPEGIDGWHFADGTPVLRDRIWRGHAFMRDVLLAMHEEEQRVAAAEGRPALTWTDAEQRSRRNDPLVIGVVQKVLARYTTQGEEVQRFLSIPSSQADATSPATKGAP